MTPTEPHCPTCGNPVVLLMNEDYFLLDENGQFIDTDDWTLEEIWAATLRDSNAWDWVCDTCCRTCPEIPIPPYVDEEEEAVKKMQMVMDL